MTAFRVGQEVVCVDASPCSCGCVSALVKGEIYRVIKTEGGFDPGIWLAEIEAPAEHDGFAAIRFRPLVTRKTDISSLEALLKTKKIEEVV